MLLGRLVHSSDFITHPTNLRPPEAPARISARTRDNPIDKPFEQEHDNARLFRQRRISER